MLKMEDNENERYSCDPFIASNQQGYGSSNRQKLPVRNAPYSRSDSDPYVDVEEDDNLEAEDVIDQSGEEDGGNVQNNGVHYVGKDVDDDDEDDEDDYVDEDADDEENSGKNYSRRIDEAELERHTKKRKVKSLISSYEFAPRLPMPPVTGPLVPKLTSVGRNPLTDWTEHETFVLLDAWGGKFLEHGRKSLRSDEWLQVAEMVSKNSKIERTDTQCRNRLDTLKKKYKKEKAKVEETCGSSSNWAYFRKMDILMSTSAQQGGLSCGLDSGEFVFLNPKAYLHRANGLDEMKDSPGNSESNDAREDDSDGLPPKKRKSGRDRNEGSTFRLLADSIYKFSDIYEKIESSKRQQMLELEKMRMDFQRDLEAQRRQIMERVQAEIAQIRQGDDGEKVVSMDNASG